MSKYHAIRTTIDGITFASRREAERYQELKLLQMAGEITDLKLQPRFRLMDATNTDRGVDYIADFMYTENGVQVVEDVKGVQTRVFRIKAKMFKSKYPQYELRIVR